MPKFNPRNKTVKELKDYARKNKIRGFSKLNKCDLICLIEKAQKQKKKPVRKTPPKKKHPPKDPYEIIRKRFETKKKPLAFTDEIVANKKVLISKDRGIFTIITNEDLKNSEFEKVLSKNKIVKNARYVILLDSINEHLYIFGNLNETLYAKWIIDKALKKLKKAKIFYKNEKPLVIKDEIYTIAIAPKIELGYILDKRYFAVIPYAKYFELRKIKKQILMDKIPFEYPTRTHKDTLIREYWLASKVLDRKILIVSQLAKLLHFKINRELTNSIGIVYWENVNSIMFNINQIKKRKFPFIKPENLTKININFQKLFKKDNEKLLIRGKKYFRYELFKIYKVFKKPTIYLNKEGLIIAKQKNIYILVAPIKQNFTILRVREES